MKRNNYGLAEIYFDAMEFLKIQEQECNLNEKK